MMVSRYAIPTGILHVDRLSTGPPVLERHNTLYLTQFITTNPHPLVCPLIFVMNHDPIHLLSRGMIKIKSIRNCKIF